MTALAAVLGLLPLALGLAEGSELQGPMGITIMGGLLSATFLTLVFLPTIFLVSERWLQRLSPSLASLSPQGGTARVPPWPPSLRGQQLTQPSGDTPPPRQEPGELPEIPDDYGREEAVPSEPIRPLPPMTTLPMPEATGDPIPHAPATPPVEPLPAAPPPMLLAGPSEPTPPPPLSLPLVLNARQRWLLETLKTVGRISRKDYAVRTGASIPTAARDLKELVGAGFIRGTGPLGPGRVYELMPPPSPP